MASTMRSLRRWREKVAAGGCVEAAEELAAEVTAERIVTSRVHAR
jgi:hypothetical protein